MQLKPGELYQFGNFTLDPLQNVLLHQGTTVPLTPKTYDLLLLFLESGGRMLPKEELMRSL